MIDREERYYNAIEDMYPGLVVRKISDEKENSYGLVLSGERDVSNSKGIPVIDYYQEVECELSGGWQTGELYEFGVSYEFQAWIDKQKDLHIEWENPGVANLYIVE
jgi:hypothetical protein